MQSISPGLVETEFSKNMTGSEELAKKLYSSIHCLQATDVAASVEHLLTAPPHVEVKKLVFLLFFTS